MISSIHGKLILKDTGFVVIECSGVGFKCFITQNTFAQIGEIGSEVFLYTYLSVREDALDLYGFYTPDEMETFKLITSVSGVGSKIGIALLSQFDTEKIYMCIVSGDAKTLTAASGVGIKLAQRIVLELKDKVGSVTSSYDADFGSVKSAVSNSSSKEAIEALVSLGFSQSEASLAVGRCDTSLSVDELIKQSLKILAKGGI